MLYYSVGNGSVLGEILTINQLLIISMPVINILSVY